jgi:hypothetical protein
VKAGGNFVQALAPVCAVMRKASPAARFLTSVARRVCMIILGEGLRLLEVSARLEEGWQVEFQAASPEVEHRAGCVVIVVQRALWWLRTVSIA